MQKAILMILVAMVNVGCDRPPAVCLPEKTAAAPAPMPAAIAQQGAISPAPMPTAIGQQIPGGTAPMAMGQQGTISPAPMPTVIGQQGATSPAPIPAPIGQHAANSLSPMPMSQQGTISPAPMPAVIGSQGTSPAPMPAAPGTQRTTSTALAPAPIGQQKAASPTPVATAPQEKDKKSNFELDGFKSVKFSMTEAQLKSMGFSCKKFEHSCQTLNSKDTLFGRHPGIVTAYFTDGKMSKISVGLTAGSRTELADGLKNSLGNPKVREYIGLNQDKYHDLFWVSTNNTAIKVTLNMTKSNDAAAVFVAYLNEIETSKLLNLYNGSLSKPIALDF